MGKLQFKPVFSLQEVRRRMTFNKYHGLVINTPVTLSFMDSASFLA
jgi:hypothetical protein